MKLKYNFYAQIIIGILTKKGVPEHEIFSSIGIPEDVSNSLDVQLTIDAIHKLTILYKKKMNTQHCGLEISENLNFQNTDFFGPYSLSCATLGEAVQKIFAIHKEVNPLISYQMSPKNNLSHFIYILDKIWEAKYPESAREIIEFVIANGLLSSRRLTQKEIIPIKIDLKYDKPKDITRYKEIFKCPVNFGSDSNSITYQSSIMDCKIPTYNAVLLNILQEYAQKIIQENEKNNDIISKVKTLIVKADKYEIPKEDVVADKLGISRRTLQKKLKEKNTSFHGILEEVQKELAIAYLTSNNVSNKEIAWILGYNDISNFYRAFKRWTGSTPNDFKTDFTIE